jgi:hypothetical protein
MWDLRGFAGGVAGGLVATAWIAPIAAAVVTIAVFLGWHPWGLQPNAVEAGLLAAVALWAVLAVVVAPVTSTRAHANPDTWGLASVRIPALEGQLVYVDPTSLHSEAARAEVTAGLDKIRKPAFGRPGLRWQTRSGYIALWRSIHHTEEAIIEAADMTHLRSVVDAYWSRVEGAQDVHLPTSLSAQLADVARFLAEGPPSAPPAPPASSPAPAPAPPPPVTSVDDARNRLRAVVAAVNELRDDSWAGLARLRLQTLTALFLTEVSAYGLLALIVSVAGDSRPAGPVVTGIIYFVVAAVVGFLARLIALSNSGTAVDDYGLQTARLLLIPVVSGLAGAGGVVLTIMLTATSFTSLTAGSDSLAVKLPSLADALNLGARPAGLAFAIVFGYAPNLLLARLDSLVATYKGAIKSTEPAGTEQSPV